MAKTQFEADPRAAEHAGFHRFLDESGEPYGGFEVFWMPAGRDECGRFTAAGWYWVAGFPGCLPDGEPLGPFKTSTEAFEDAQRC